MAITTSKMRITTELGCDFWNDSCDARELSEAVEAGASGATSNPVIVSQVVQADRGRWLPVLDCLIVENPTATEDEIAWLLVEALARDAATVLAPVHTATGHRKGYLSVQVNPQLYRDAKRMAMHGRVLTRLARNVAIKIPATEAGLQALETLTAEGIRVNATVCFTVSQAVACAEAIERGFARAAERSVGTTTLHPTVTIMVGRLDDHLKRVQERDGVTIDPGYCNWAGIAVFKTARAIFRARNYRATLLAAAYRHHLHWSELVGAGVILTMPYMWWKRFDASHVLPEPRLDLPVEPRITDELRARFADFRLAQEEGALAPNDFARYGASVHTLQQFLGGYQQLLELVRGRMLG